MSTQFAALSAPFPAKEIDWRPGATNQAKTSALALAYISARPVMDRLDEVMGPLNWRDSYHVGPQGGVLCRLELRFDGEWIAKEDGADNSEMEAVKGGLSDAFKRAAVKWGIGRYLYDLPTIWHPCEAYGKTIKLVGIPPLPKWALPAGDTTVARVSGADVPHDPPDNDAVAHLPPMDVPKSAAKASPGVPPWWPEFRQLKAAKHVTDSAIEEIIGAGPTLQAVSAWLETNTDTNFAQLVTLAEAKQKELMGAR